MDGELPHSQDSHLSKLSQSSELNDDDLRRLEESAQPGSTVRATNYAVNKLNRWCKKRNITIDWHTVTPSDLNTTLCKFYAEVKPEKK